MQLNVLSSENVLQCRACRGQCCKTLPGATFPSDWGNDPVAAVLEGLKSGRYTLDWWEGDVLGGPLYRSLYVRPAVKGKEGRIEDPAWGHKPCTFLTSTGCSLPFEKTSLCL